MYNWNLAIALRMILEHDINSFFNQVVHSPYIGDDVADKNKNKEGYFDHHYI